MQTKYYLFFVKMSTQDDRYPGGRSAKLLKNTRRKSDAIKEYAYDIPDELCSSESFKGKVTAIGICFYFISLILENNMKRNYISLNLYLVFLNIFVYKIITSFNFFYYKVPLG